MKISCAMITKNESRCIERCLLSLKDMVDEIIVLDVGSTDLTVQIAESLGAKVYHFEWCNDFSAARNASLEHATGDWILVVDADEYFTQNFRPAMEQFVKEFPQNVGKLCQRKRFYDSVGDAYTDTYITRFFPKGLRYTGLVNEVLDTSKEAIATSLFVIQEDYSDLPMLMASLEKKPDDSQTLYLIGRLHANKKDYQQALFYFVKAFDYGSPKASFYPNLVFDSIFACVRTSSFELGLDFRDYALAHFPDYAELYYYSGILFMEAALFDINRYGHFFNHIETSYKHALAIGDTPVKDGLLGAGSFLSAHNLAVYYETTGDRINADYYYNLAESQKRKRKTQN